MRTGIILLSLIVLLLLVAVMPIAGGLSATAIYYSPVFILLLALLAGTCLWCCLRRRLRFGETGFLLVHLAVVLVLAGAFAGFLFGREGQLRLALDSRRYTSALPAANRQEEPQSFGFGIAASDFTLEFHPPTYKLYRPLPPEELEPGQMPYEQSEEFKTENAEFWNLGAAGDFAVSNLRDAAAGRWRPQYRLPNGEILALARQTPAYYGVALLIRDGEQEFEEQVAVNAPASYAGWRFYLMSYDSRNRSYVDIFARRDPGRGAVIAGIWMLIAGSFVVAFQRKNGRGAA